MNPKWLSLTIAGLFAGEFFTFRAKRNVGVHISSLVNIYDTLPPPCQPHENSH
jgi:hypothetical protein